MNVSLRKVVSLILALTVCFPFSFPAPPMYLFSYFALILVIAYGWYENARIPSAYLLAYVLLCSSLLVSTVVSHESFAITALLGILVSPLFFSFGFFVDQKTFFSYFWKISLLNSTLIIITFFLMGMHSYGLEIMINPLLRVWGSALFYDWPNYIVMIPLLAIFSRYLFERKIDYIFLAVNSTAALLTTSRVALLGLALFFAIYLIDRKRFVALCAMLILAVTYLTPILSLLEQESQLTSRLLKTDDRQRLFIGLVDAFWQKPLLGWGVVSVEAVLPETLYNSYHNSFLESAVRGGLMNLVILAGFLYFMFRAFYYNRLVAVGSSAKILFILFVISASLTQNFLRHPNISIILSMMCFAAVKNKDTGYLPADDKGREAAR